MKLETINLLTAGAASVGYVAGLALDRAAIKKAGQNKASLNEYFGITAENSDPKKLSRWTRLGKTALAPLALVGAVTAGVNSYAWLPENQTLADQPATVVMVVDRSGATGLNIDNQPVYSQINTVVEQIAEINGINAEAVVANTGTQQLMKPEKAIITPPFGEANMASATSLALNRTAQVVPIANGIDVARNAAVVVITNGNSIGKLDKVVANSKIGNGINEPTPVFVVDVKGNKVESTTVELQNIAAKTGARYWSANSSDLDQVAQEVKEAVSSIETSKQINQNNWTLKVLGITALAGFLIMFKKRGDMPFDRGIKGE